MKLNLASGTDIRDGWMNLDIVHWPSARRPPDILWDARKDKIPFPDNFAEEIYAGYLLLHLAPGYHKPVLSEIHRVLSPNGILVVGEVDMGVVIQRWLQNPLDVRCCELIWGEQGNWGEQGKFKEDEYAQYDKHCHGFTEESLKQTLKNNGFTNFNRIKLHPHPDVFYELTLTCKKFK